MKILPAVGRTSRALSNHWVFGNRNTLMCRNDGAGNRLPLASIDLGLAFCCAAEGALRAQRALQEGFSACLSFDDLVGSGEDRRRNAQPECLGRL